ncbi:MAG TPA: HAD family hydrolase, partial [Opitutales bacterium]|nr:HAD family hydrolase [Opitutales bacterium]
SVMVVSCPCAIGLAYPRLNDRVVQRLREFGVYVRTHSMWNRMEKVRDVVFDKTGTLTLEVLEWENPEIMDRWSEADRMLLFMLVDRNLHPVGKSIRQEMLSRWPQWSTRRYDELPMEEHVGSGISMRWQGQDVYLGLRAGSGLEGNPRDTVFVRGNEELGIFRFKESVRIDARPAIERLNRAGYRVWVLSGDKKSKVEAMTRSLGLPDDHGLAEMGPDAKAAWIGREGFGPALMVGDGANGALAFERALCRATPVLGQGLLEGQADYYFLGRGIDGVCEVFELTRVRRSVLLQLFVLTLTYNAAAVSMALAGWMSPLIAAVLMPLSSIVTVSWASFSGRMRSRDSIRRS